MKVDFFIYVMFYNDDILKLDSSEQINQKMFKLLKYSDSIDIKCEKIQMNITISSSVASNWHNNTSISFEHNFMLFHI
jgi:hypothetical protein